MRMLAIMKMIAFAIATTAMVAFAWPARDAHADTVVLTWQASIDSAPEQTPGGPPTVIVSGVGWYNIYRQAAPCPDSATNIPGPPVGKTNAQTLTYADMFTVDSCWAVTAVDNAGNESAQSNKVSKAVEAQVPTFILKAIGSPPATIGVEMVASAQLPTGTFFDIFVNGAKDSTEAEAPYCWGAEVSGECAGVPKPAGSYAIEARLMRGTVEISRSFLTVIVTGPGPSQDITAPTFNNSIVVQ